MCGVTFKITPGDRKAIICPSGADKTTLFNLITGIYSASSGQVLLFGPDVTIWPSHYLGHLTAPSGCSTLDACQG